MSSEIKIADDIYIGFTFDTITPMGRPIKCKILEIDRKYGTATGEISEKIHTFLHKREDGWYYNAKGDASP